VKNCPAKTVRVKNCPIKKLSGRRIVRFAEKNLSEELSGEKFSGRRTVRGKKFQAKNYLCVKKFNEELSGRRIIRFD
jgi:hypothetical protein